MNRGPKNVKTKSLLQNTTIASIEKVFGLLVNILLLPIIIKTLGVIGYGQWVFLFTVSNYFMLAQFGISVSFKKFISEDLVLKKNESVKEFVCTAFYTLLLITAVIVLLSIIISPFIFAFFKIGGDVHDNSFALNFLIFASSIGLINEIAVSIPQCYQRFDIASYIGISGKIIYLIIVLSLVFFHLTIPGLIFAVLISNISVFVLNLFFSYKLFPQLSLSPGFIKKNQFKRMFQFGVKLQVVFLATYIANNLDKLLIGKFLGPTYITIYDIGSKIISFFREIPYVFFLVIMPYSSELYMVNEIEKLKKICSNYTAHFVLICSVLFAFVFYNAESILKFWIGNNVNPLSVYILRVLLVGSIVHLSTGIMTTILKVTGNLRPELIGNLTIAIINFLLSIVLIFLYGIKGVVWGTTIGFVFGSIVIYFLSTKAYKMNFGKFLGQIFIIPIVNAVVFTSINFYLGNKLLIFCKHNEFQEILINFNIGFGILLLNLVILYKLKLLPRFFRKITNDEY